MSHSQTVSAGENLIMEQIGFPKETDEVEEVDEVVETETDEVEEVDEVEERDEVEESKRQKRFQYLNSCVPLYQAAFKGDWQEAKALLDRYPNMVRVPITIRGDTALHIAAAANHPNFVTELLKRTSGEDLELKNKYGQTALYFAAASGNVIIAEEMLEKNENLALIRVENGMKYTPLYIAALLGRREMVSFLFCVTPFQSLSAKERIELLVATISEDLFDIALRIMMKDKRLATTKDINGRTALYELARKPFAIGSKSQLSVSKRCLKSWFKRIYNKAPMQTLARQLVEGLWREVRLLQEPEFSNHVVTFLFEAAKMGNAELLIIVIRSYPDLIWKTDSKCRTIFHIAVLYRQECVFKLLYEIGAIKDIILTYVDDEGQNILHLAGQLAPPSRLNMVSGAAFQMQREILWFKEVERLVLPSYLNMKSKDRRGEGLTPWDLFTREHEKLRADGEKWIEGKVNFYIVVATLISAVDFAAVITVPGGSNQDKGTPILMKSIWFRVFFISNAIALLSSSVSIIMYLSIFTSGFTEHDFLKSLPLKLELGFTTLVISILGMVVAFSATCFLAFKSELTWLPIVIIALAGVLIISFVLRHCQLWFGIIHSAYLSKFLFRQRKNRLFNLEDDQ